MVGVIHVHSTYSDGTGTVEQIARVAEQQGLDFLILTDHNTLQAKSEGQEGRRGNTLVMIGQEISTAQGHYLAFRDGLGFIPHPVWRKSPWKGPLDQGFTGIEVYNAADDATSEKFPLLPGFWTLAIGADAAIVQWLDRPDRALELWDRLLAQGRPIVGIGGADAHGLRWMGLRLAPYSAVFKLVRNHLFISGDLTESAVYEALEQGHLFVAHDLVADATGFQFLAMRDGQVSAVMGDSVPGAAGLTLVVHLPSPGEIFLFRNGEVVARATGHRLEWQPVQPGVYRVEARRKGRPWIYSNPIYVLE